jgi:uncharacterized protein (DUF1501 family)
MNKRQFLKASLASIGALTTSSGLAGQLQIVNSMAEVNSAQRFGDHKAMVCIFLYGGHDSFNLVVPSTGNDYQDYARTRQSLAYQQEDLVGLNQTDTMDLGVHRNASALQQLFNSGRASIVSNMGPMLAPATKSELLSNSQLKPPQLFSHNDQQSLWQSGLMDTNNTSGWGGRMADLLMDANQRLPLSFSLGGTNQFQSGRIAQHYSMNSEGVEQFGGLNPTYDWNNARIEHHLRMVNSADDTFSRAYANKILDVRENNANLSAALAPIDATSVDYGTNEDLAKQLQAIAKLIAAQSTLGQSRQIFFASLGGFDTHDNQAYLLPRLQQTLSLALAGFDADLQARGLSEQVVTFTQSEFGRTLTSNGDGTDHGWAGNQIIMGGPVRGGRIFGDMPAQVINSNDDLGDGRIIPTTSIDQFGAEIAQWFGLGQSEINDVFPNLHRFDPVGLNMFS